MPPKKIDQKRSVSEYLEREVKRRPRLLPHAQDIQQVSDCIVKEVALILKITGDLPDIAEFVRKHVELLDSTLMEMQLPVKNENRNEKVARLKRELGHAVQGNDLLRHICAQLYLMKGATQENLAASMKYKIEDLDEDIELLRKIGVLRMRGERPAKLRVTEPGRQAILELTNERQKSSVEDESDE